MNSSGPRGRRRGKPDTRALILDVARRRFLNGGYRAFTLRAIAAEAGVDFESGAPMRALVAGAAHDAAFAAVIKGTMEQAVIEKIADRIGGQGARERAAAFYAQVAGVIGTRYILCLEPIASMSSDELVEIYRAPLRLALDTVPPSQTRDT